MLGFHFDKAAGLQLYDFIKKRFQHRCFPVIIAKFLRIKELCHKKHASREVLSL